MTKKNKYIFYTFIKFVKNELKLTDGFKIKLSENKDEFKTYAYYSPNDNLIAVYIKNRALADIMRSAAHELIHHQQNQNGKIDSQPIQDIGGPIEDEANAVAGQLIKKFGYSFKEYDIYSL